MFSDVQFKMNMMKKSESLILVILIACFVFNTNIVYCKASAHEKSNSSETVVAGQIDSDIFRRSVPATMIVGKKYPITIVVANTGSMTANFTIHLSFPFQVTLKYFYYQRVREDIVLPPGLSEKVEFTVIPMIEHLGPLNMTANLYSTSSGQNELIHSVPVTIRYITAKFPVELMYLTILISCISIISFVLIFLRKTVKRNELIIAFMLFILSILIRATKLSIVSIYPDEVIIWYNSCWVLHDNWKMSERLLKIYPPLYFYLEACLIRLFGYQLEVFRILPILASSVSVVVLYFLGKSLFRKKIGLLAALLFCFYNYHILFSRISMTDSLVLLFNLLFMYFLWRGYEEKRSIYMCLSGFFLGLSINTKYISIVYIPFTILLYIWINRSYQ